MQFTGGYRNRMVKHYLRQWYYFDENVEWLGSLEEAKMKTLYASLKELSPDTLRILSDKYRLPEKISDKDAAKGEGLNHEAYRKKRILAEKEMNTLLLKNKKKFEKEYIL